MLSWTQMEKYKWQLCTTVTNVTWEKWTKSAFNIHCLGSLSTIAKSEMWKHSLSGLHSINACIQCFDWTLPSMVLISQSFSMFDSIRGKLHWFSHILFLCNMNVCSRSTNLGKSMKGREAEQKVESVEQVISNSLTDHIRRRTTWLTWLGASAGARASNRNQ